MRTTNNEKLDLRDRIVSNTICLCICKNLESRKKAHCLPIGKREQIICRYAKEGENTFYFRLPSQKRQTQLVNQVKYIGVEIIQTYTSIVSLIVIKNKSSVELTSGS